MGQNLIITHCGRAHFDDFCAIALIVAYFKDKEFCIERRDPTFEELNNPNVWVVDIGNSLDASLKNFDHHQDLALPPSFALVAEHLGFKEAFEIFLWWEYKKDIDTLGPTRVAQKFKVESILPMESPLELAILNNFANIFDASPYAKEKNHTKEDKECMLNFLYSFGKGLITKSTKLKEQYNFFESCPTYTIKNKKVMVCKTDESFGIVHYCEKKKNDAPQIILSYDNRGEGWKISRIKDNKGINFSNLENHPDIKFAHKGGFIAKTNEKIDTSKLFKLIENSITTT